MGRQNTIRIDYGALPNKPNLQKVQKFCAEKLGLKRGEVIRIQSSRALGVTFVTLVDLDLAIKVCEEHNKKHQLTGSDKKQYSVAITVEDGTVLVKLFDLSDDVPNNAVAKFLERYGEVQDVYEETLDDTEEFAGAYTGVRIAKMVVKENIASWVTISGELTHLSYYGQRQTCKHCLDFLHIGVGCVQNKKLLVQKTFADAVKQPAKPLGPNPKPKPQEQPPKPKGDGKGPLLPLTPVEKPKKSKRDTPNQLSNEGNGSSPQMPPPAGVLPSGSGLQENFIYLHPHAGGAAMSKPPSGKSDGNETDSSTSSRKSTLRNASAKKPRYTEKNDADDDDDEQEDGEEEL